MLNQHTQTLLNNFQTAPKLKTSSDAGFTVSQAVSAAAVLYEAARNAVEFRAEHLIRRAAIERILRRRLLTKPSGEGIAEPLIRELLWARYLENGSVPKNKLSEIQISIDKYIALKTAVLKKEQKKDYFEWIIGIASCEIEKKLTPAPNREALINFVYQSLKERVSIENEKSSSDNNIQTYIAVHRAYALSDEPIIRFQLFQSYLPDWINQGPEDIEKIAAKFTTIYQNIETKLNHPLKDKLKHFVKAETAPFLVIRDLYEEDPDKFREIVSSPDTLTIKANDLLNKRYLEIKTRLRRAATRSILYIFLTKMLFAFLIELPFDYLLKKINYLAIGINTLFPPFLMFAFTASINFPNQENTDKVIQKMKEYLYDDSNKDKIKFESNKPTSNIFTLVYLFTFVIIFGLIIIILNKLHFSIVSKAVFLFFLSVVSFFAYRVRLDTKDYVIQEKESAITPVTDFIFLPILRVGQWLSGQLQQINFLLFFLDFIIEAPFKAFFYVAEEWIHFMRTKKEEIVA